MCARLRARSFFTSIQRLTSFLFILLHKKKFERDLSHMPATQPLNGAGNQAFKRSSASDAFIVATVFFTEKKTRALQPTSQSLNQQPFSIRTAAQKLFVFYFAVIALLAFVCTKRSHTTVASLQHTTIASNCLLTFSLGWALFFFAQVVDTSLPSAFLFGFLATFVERLTSVFPDTQPLLD